MTGQRQQCSAAPFHQDRHMATGLQWLVTDPEGRQFVFCSGCCLLTYAVRGALPADVASNTGSTSGDTAAHAREAA
jgi:hypothetical protein